MNEPLKTKKLRFKVTQDVEIEVGETAEPSEIARSIKPGPVVLGDLNMKILGHRFYATVIDDTTRF